MASGRQLKLTLIGDSKQLERTLGRTETRLQRFGKSAGVKSAGGLALLSGNVGGAGFFAAAAGAAALGEALKTGVADAASLQKSGEAIDNIFGSAGVAVKKFAQDAHTLGISAVESEALSTRLGILTRNLGIGAEKGARMAVGLQELAGSIAEIRGIDPATVLGNLPQALAGNLRSLKQLGFAFSQAQIKAEAMKEGLIGLNGALTPAAKAEAIYALATKHLADFQREAAANSGDLTNQTHQLSAEWSNLTATLSKDVTIPLLTAMATSLNIDIGLVAQLKDSLKSGWNWKVPGTDWIKNPLGNVGGSPFGDQPAGTRVSTRMSDSAFAALNKSMGRSQTGHPNTAAPGHYKVTKPITQQSNRLLGEELDARLSGSSGRLKKVLEKEAAFLKNALGDIRIKPAERNALKSALLGVQDEITSINQTATDAANQAAQIAADASKQAASDAQSAAQKAKAAAAAANAKRKQAMADALAASVKFLDNLKQGALDALQGRQTKVDVGRQMADAKDALRTALQEGGKRQILEARRGIQDAQFAKERQQIEGAKFKSEGKGTAGITISGGIHLHGVHNVKQLIAELERHSKRKGHQSRGRAPGIHAA